MPRLFTALEIPRDAALSLSLLRGGLPGARWIDVGCGNGQLLLRLRDYARFANHPLIGVDVSVAVATAAARGLRTVKADGEFLPFRDASVAAVLPAATALAGFAAILFSAAMLLGRRRVIA